MIFAGWTPTEFYPAGGRGYALARPARACGAGRAGRPQHHREGGQGAWDGMGTHGRWQRPFTFLYSSSHGSAIQVMLAGEHLSRNTLNINVVYTRKLGQSITC